MTVKPALKAPLNTAMVLAAGFGKRMMPLTEKTPKPLLEVGGRAMLDRALDKAADAGVTKAVVNSHYLADRIADHVESRVTDGAGPDIVVSHEAEILETGGGVLKALGALGDDPFFVLNSDTVWDDGPTPALSRMAAAWDPARMDALLLLHPTVAAFGYGGKGDFHMDVEGHLLRRIENEIAPFVFTGNQILNPALFDGLSPGRFSLNTVYDRALETERLFGIRHDGAWYHVGTPDSLDRTNAIFHKSAQPIYF